jgi:type III secretory pathway component EscV
MKKTQRIVEIEQRLEALSIEREQLGNELHPLIIEQIKDNLNTLAGIQEIKYFLADLSEYCGIVKFDLYNLIKIKEKELNS